MAAINLPGVVEGAGTPGHIDEVDLLPVRTYWNLVMARFRQNRLAVVGLIMLVILVVSSIAFPIIGGDAWRLTHLDKIRAPATLAAPLGYDSIGINIFMRLMKALQTSLIIGFTAVLIITFVGHHRRVHRRVCRRQARQRAHAVRRHRALDPDVLPHRDARRLLRDRQHLGHHHRPRPDAVDDRGPARPGGVPVVARGRFRAGGPGTRGERPADRHPAHGPERARAGHRRGHAGHRRLGRRRGVPVVPRLRHRAARGEPRQHAHARPRTTSIGARSSSGIRASP